MDIGYILGGKSDFFGFIESIGLYDKVAVFSHNDLDGIASGLFIEKILEAKGIKVNLIKFLEIKSDMVKEVFMDIDEKGITKIFFSDLNIEAIDPEGFLELRNEKDVFLIDHHPIGEGLKDKSKIIKVVSEDCTSLVIFALGEGILDYGVWGWLVSSAMFADYSFRSEKNLRFIQSIYPEVTFDNISTSIPGLNARKISSALIYYKNDVNYVYNLLKEKNLEELSEIHGIIEEEVYKIVDDFVLNKEYFPKNDLYFYEIKSRFDVLSYVATLIAGADPGKNYLFMIRLKDSVNFSARSSEEKIDVGVLMKKGIEGLTGAAGGGHITAAGAVVNPEDAEIFMKRVLE